MAFASQVLLSDPNNAGGTNDATLVYDLQQALNVWSGYISGLGTLVVQLNIGSAVGRASGGPTSYSAAFTNNGLTVWEPSSFYELTTGQHINGTTSDITINIDQDYLQYLDFTTNLTYGSQVAGNKYNPIVIFLHELVHGFGM